MIRRLHLALATACSIYFEQARRKPAPYSVEPSIPDCSQLMFVDEVEDIYREENRRWQAALALTKRLGIDFSEGG